MLSLAVQYGYLNLPLNKLQYLVLSGVKVRPGIHKQKIHSAPFYLKKKILVRDCMDIRRLLQTLQTVTKSCHSIQYR